MQNTVRPSTRPSGPVISDFDRLAARYRDLQAELTDLVGRCGAACRREEAVRHALEASLKLHDAIIVAELIEAQQPVRILEVGNRLGFSTRWILEASRASGAAVASLDPDVRYRVFNRPSEICRRFNGAFLSSRLIQKCGFFAERFTADCYYDYEQYPPVVPRDEVGALLRGRPVFDAGNLGEGTFDFVFINGDHSDRAVQRQFEEAYRLLRPRGCIAFRDALSWPNVGRALGKVTTRFAGDVEVCGRGHADSCDGIGVFRRR